MTIDDLRDALAEVDHELLKLVARRHELVSEIGATKRATVAPTRDFEQEKLVVDRARLADVSSTTFDAQLDVARAVSGENARMYFEIQSLNEFGDLALASLEDAVGQLREAVRAGSEESFVALMEAGRDYLASRS